MVERVPFDVKTANIDVSVVSSDADDLWHRYVGSSKLTPRTELRLILEAKSVLRWNVAYQLYMRSKVWRAIRMKVLNRDGFKCVRCGSTASLQVNHKTYEDEWGSEKMGNLETLCRLCHSDVTKRYDLMRGSVPNKIDVSDGKLHLAMRRASRKVGG